MKQIAFALLAFLSISCSAEIEYVEVITEAHSKIESIAITTKTDNLFTGETLLLTYVLSPICTIDKPIRFVSSDEKIATVDQTGKVIAKSPGKVIISIQSVSDKPVNSSIELLIKEQSQGLYAIGDYFPSPNDPNTAIGIVYYIDVADESFLIHNGVEFSKRGKIISLDEKKDVPFSLINEYVPTAISYDNGEANTLALSALENYETNYPPVKWALDKNTKTSIVRWYLPAEGELLTVYLNIFGPKYYSLKIYDKFEPANGQPLSQEPPVYYVSSSVEENYIDKIGAVSFYDGINYMFHKNYKYRVRAIAKF